MRRLMLLCLLVLAGCANSAGIAEFAAYRGSFQELRASATPLFDLLEVEERERMEGKKRDHVDRRATEDFVVKDAAIYSTLTEPPLTTAYRRSFDVVTRYNTVMAGLANGQRGSELAADAASLARQANGLAVLAGSNKFVTDVAVGALRELADVALQYRSRQVFLSRFPKTAGTAKDLITTMKDNSVQIFDTIAPPNLSDADKAERERIRSVVSDFVILLERSEDALDVAVEAAKSGRTEFSFEALERAVQDAGAAARALRMGVAELKTD